MAQENPANAPSVCAQLENIMMVFSLHEVHLAELLGVSRREVVEWRQGQTPSEAHQGKVGSRHVAAKRFEQAGLVTDYSTKHRMIESDLEFIEALAQDPHAAVETLIELCERGRLKRARLEEHYRR